jgi:hypothetical protein
MRGDAFFLSLSYFFFLLGGNHSAVLSIVMLINKSFTKLVISYRMEAPFLLPDRKIRAYSTKSPIENIFFIFHSIKT